MDVPVEVPVDVRGENEERPRTEGVNQRREKNKKKCYHNPVSRSLGIALAFLSGIHTKREGDAGRRRGVW